MTDKRMAPPFIWFGGKRRWAPEVWQRFGRPDRYLEPFAGSLAILLARPKPIKGLEIVSDLDGFICNFWRSIRADPDKVAYHADYPTIHQDLEARHRCVLKWRKKKALKLSKDPDFHDCKIAGYWAWGVSLSITGGWQQSKVYKGIPAVMPDGGGRGVSRLRGMPPGATKRDLDLVDGSRLRSWFGALSTRLSKVEVLNRDWRSFRSPTLLGDIKSSGEILTAVFLDPPYKGYNEGMYGATDGVDAATDSYEWAVEHGERYRIAYCCHEGDFEVPAGWESSTMTFSGIRDPERRAETNDCVMFSPACAPKQGFGLSGRL